jgi:hypothetical protein
MLIYLAKELGNQFAQLSQSVTFGNAMRNLALCEREGKHVLAGSYAVLTQLKKWDELSQRERSVFERCHTEIQTRLYIRKHSSALIEVSAVKAGEIRRVDEGQQLRFVVPYGYFADSARVQPMRLLGENMNDAELYKRAAAVYLHQFGPTGDSSQATIHRKLLQLCLSPRGAGGSQLGAELELAAKTEMVLAIADGDIRYPGGTPKNHTTQVGAQAALAKLKGQAVAELLITEGRSAENLLPDAGILAHLFPDAPAETRQEWLSDAQRRLLADADARRHLDLRAGLRLWEKFPGTESIADELRFLEDVAARHAPQATTTSDCLTACKAASKKLCQCVVIKGLGKELLASAIEHMTQTPPAEQTLTPDLKRIARQVAAFGCAVKPQRAGRAFYP